MGFAEPAERMSFGYVMNRMGEGLGLNSRGQSLIDAQLATGGKSGYNFVATQTDLVAGVSPATFYATAVPQVTAGIGQTGTRRFGVATDGTLHGDSGGALAAYANEAAVLAAPALGN